MRGVEDDAYAKRRYIAKAKMRIAARRIQRPHKAQPSL